MGWQARATETTQKLKARHAENVRQLADNHGLDMAEAKSQMTQEHDNAMAEAKSQMTQDHDKAMAEAKSQMMQEHDNAMAKAKSQMTQEHDKAMAEAWDKVLLQWQRLFITQFIFCVQIINFISQVQTKQDLAEQKHAAALVQVQKQLSNDHATAAKRARVSHQAALAAVTKQMAKHQQEINAKSSRERADLCEDRVEMLSSMQHQMHELVGLVVSNTDQLTDGFVECPQIHVMYIYFAGF